MVLRMAGINRATTRAIYRGVILTSILLTACSKAQKSDRPAPVSSAPVSSAPISSAPAPSLPAAPAPAGSIEPVVNEKVSCRDLAAQYELQRKAKSPADLKQWCAAIEMIFAGIDELQAGSGAALAYDYSIRCLPVLLEKSSSSAELAKQGEAVKGFITDFGRTPGDKEEYIKGPLPAIIEKGASVEEMRQWHEAVKAITLDYARFDGSDRGKFQRQNFISSELAEMVAASRLPEILMIAYPLRTDFEKRFGNPSYFMSSALPLTIVRVETAEMMTVARSLIIDFNARIGEPHEYVERLLPAMLLLSNSPGNIYSIAEAPPEALRTMDADLKSIMMGNRPSNRARFWLLPALAQLQAYTPEELKQIGARLIKERQNRAGRK